MAEERNLGWARAPEAGDEDSTKAELQRRMEEARESITQTVAEIRDTVVNKYESVKESVSETLDWREQYRRRPVAWSVSALGVGLVVGYSLAGAFMGGDEEDYSDVWNEDYAPKPKTYAAQAITGGSFGSSALAPQAARSSAESSYQGAPSAQASGTAPTASAAYASGTSETEQEEEEDKGPGLIERFKGTKAYDRLEEEVSHLGERFVDELSRTAQTVVLPMLFNKIKNYFGLDLSGKQGQRSQPQAGRASGTQQAATSQTGTSQADQGQGSTSYGKSPNLPYGAQSP